MSKYWVFKMKLVWCGIKILGNFPLLEISQI